VLCDMAYNFGLARRYQLKKLLAALEESREMLNSKWAQQVGKRVEELSVLMLHGGDTII